MAKFIGKFVDALPLVEGENNGKRWARRTVLLSTMDGDEKVIAFTLFGEDKIHMFDGVQRAQLIMLFYSLSTREFNGKWFTEARVVSAQVLANAPVNV